MLAAFELLCCLSMLFDFRFKRVRTLLQLSQGAELRIERLGRTTLDRKDLGVRAADGKKTVGIRRVLEAANRIGAEQRKGKALGEIVPQLLELQSRLVVLFCPQEI